MNRQVLTYARNHGIKESQPPERAGGEIKPSVRGMMMTMDNHNNDTDTLEALFALSREAVLGVREGRVTFGNAAAVRLFGREVRGESLAGLLPELETLPGEERFVTAADVGGTVSITLVFGTSEDGSSVIATVATEHPFEDTFILIPYQNKVIFADSYELVLINEEEPAQEPEGDGAEEAEAPAGNAQADEAEQAQP